MGWLRKVVNKYTGRDMYDEAVDAYYDVTDEYETARKNYEEKTQELNDKLAKQIEEINFYKEYIQTNLFRNLVEMLSLLKDVEVPEEFTEEKYQKQCKKLDKFMKIRSRDALISIDFDRHKVKTALQSIFTLGFYTRKQAAESLARVEQEVSALKSEMQTMDCEIANLEAMVASAQNIANYFMKMSNLFEKWLRYMEHAIHYVGYASMRISKRILKHSVSISILHEKQKKELEATITLGKVLSELIQVQMVVNKDGGNLKEYEEKMQNHYEKHKDEDAA